MPVIIKFKKELNIEFDITSHEGGENRISTCVYAVEGGWVNQYINITTLEAMLEEYKYIKSKIKKEKRSQVKVALNWISTQLKEAIQEKKQLKLF